MKYSKDGIIKFDEGTHTYWNGEKKLQSVTSYISQFKQPFDKEKISFYYAKKHGLDQFEVLEEWERKGRESCEMGTAVHLVFEKYILGEGIVKTGDYPKEEIAEFVINDLFESERLIPVETEYIVYNDDLAGQVDCIAKNQKGEYFILDWKTNEEIKQQSFKNKKMLKDYSDYPDCNFYHYKIQLDTYKSMCTEYKIKDSFIVHLDNDNYNLLKV